MESTRPRSSPGAPYPGRVRRLVVSVLLLGSLAVGCGSDDSPANTTGDDTGDITADGTGDITGHGTEAAYREQMAAISEAVKEWAGAGDIATAHSAAEAAANLVVGLNGPGYGDRDGDGTIEGETEFGILPGLDGTPAGLADALADNECIAADVLGGSWDDPAARWAQLDEVVAAWTDANNTMPSLASHAMRVVGWALLTLGTDEIAIADEYGGHAQLHVAVSLDALDCST